MTIILERHQLDKRRSSDRELARLTEQTIEEFDADTTAPDPRDNGDLMTLAEYCDAVAIYGPTRTRLIQYVDCAMDRMEARGHDVPEPWRRTRWDWYRDYNAVLAQDDRETEMGARYAGVPR